MIHAGKCPQTTWERAERLRLIRAARHAREQQEFATAADLFDHAEGMAGMSKINAALRHACRQMVSKKT